MSLVGDSRPENRGGNGLWQVEERVPFSCYAQPASRAYEKVRSATAAAHGAEDGEALDVSSHVLLPRKKNLVDI